MSKEKAIKDMIAGIGGEENIENAWHCMTRLRFELKDKNKVDIAKIKELDPVLGAQFNQDQFQIILGPKVGEYYTVLANELKLKDAQSPEEEKGSKQKVGFVTLFMNIVSGVFGPIVPKNCWCGINQGTYCRFDCTSLHLG